MREPPGSMADALVTLTKRVRETPKPGKGRAGAWYRFCQKGVTPDAASGCQPRPAGGSVSQRYFRLRGLNERTHETTNVSAQQIPTNTVDNSKRLIRDVVPSKRDVILHDLSLRRARPVFDEEGRVHVLLGGGERGVVERDGRGAAGGGGAELFRGDPQVGGTVRDEFVSATSGEKGASRTNPVSRMQFMYCAGTPMPTGA